MTTRVLNLNTGEHITYVGLTPYQAVIAAYAQSLGNMNTWQYEEKYARLVQVGRFGVHLKHFSCPFA